MTEYHKIQTLFKRHRSGPEKGKMIMNAWSTPELEYLSGSRWEFTEKVDGTNIRVYINRNGDVRFEGRTNRAVIPTPLLAYLNETFVNNKKIQAWFDTTVTEEVVLYGEGYGPKIQNGGLYRDDPSFVIFDIKIGEWWLLREDVEDIAEKMGIDTVPVIGYGTLWDAIQLVSGFWTLDEFGHEDQWVPPLKSEWGDFTSEGIVARPEVALFDRAGNRIITKIKVVDFK